VFPVTSIGAFTDISPKGGERGGQRERERQRCEVVRGRQTREKQWFPPLPVILMYAVPLIILLISISSIEIAASLMYRPIITAETKKEPKKNQKEPRDRVRQQQQRGDKDKG